MANGIHRIPVALIFIGYFKDPCKTFQQRVMSCAIYPCGFNKMSSSSKYLSIKC